MHDGELMTRRCLVERLGGSADAVTGRRSARIKVASK